MTIPYIWGYPQRVHIIHITFGQAPPFYLFRWVLLRGYFRARVKSNSLWWGHFRSEVRICTPSWKYLLTLSWGLARGSKRSEWERSTFLSDFRRELSLAGAKAYSFCLLGRVARVGEEYSNTANRRAWVRTEDERREEDSQAHWLANVLWPICDQNQKQIFFLQI